MFFSPTSCIARKLFSSRACPTGNLAITYAVNFLQVRLQRRIEFGDVTAGDLLKISSIRVDVMGEVIGPQHNSDLRRVGRIGHVAAVGADVCGWHG